MLNISEAHLMKQLRIKNWTHLSTNQFLVYLKLAPQISDDLHSKIMMAVPNYNDMANETAVSLKMLIRNKQIMIMGREKRIARCIEELKPTRDQEDSTQRMLGVLSELSRLYVDCRSHHKQTISVLAKYGLAIFYFILLLLSRMQDSDDWI